MNSVFSYNDSQVCLGLLVSIYNNAADRITDVDSVPKVSISKINIINSHYLKLYYTTIFYLNQALYFVFLI